MDRCYGGPEEGGWWYDTGRFVQCHAQDVNQARALEIEASLRQYIKEQHRGQRPVWSVQCDG